MNNTVIRKEQGDLRASEARGKQHKINMNILTTIPLSNFELSSYLRYLYIRLSAPRLAEELLTKMSVPSGIGPLLQSAHQLGPRAIVTASRFIFTLALLRNCPKLDFCPTTNFRTHT